MPMRRLRRGAAVAIFVPMRVALLFAAVVALPIAGHLTAQANDAHSSKAPPAGPPWVTDFAAARAAAIAGNKPIFVYSTKTYCPHCVVMEKGLLADKALAADYDAVVWMYLFQDFSQSDADRAAERVAIRFGISSWPQHFLVDPFTLAKVADTGRDLRSFRAAVHGTKIAPSECTPSVVELAAADALAKKLEKGADVALAREHLQHDDRVVACRALQLLAKKAPKELVAHSESLLVVPNDQIRGIVCDILAEHGDVEAKDVLHDLLRDPGQSENPNVLRIRATKALARCGDASSLPVIEPFATSGHYRNGLTMIAIRSIATIAGRSKKSKADAVAILAKAYPPLPAGTDAATELRMCETLAKGVHDVLSELTGKRVEFPAEYTDASRTVLMQSW